MHHLMINAQIQDKLSHDMYVSFHLENDNMKVYRLVKQTNVFDNLLNTKNKRKFYLKKKEEEEISLYICPFI